VTTCSKPAYIDGDDFVVEIVGDIDYQVGRALYEELRAVLGLVGARRFVVDMRAVPFIDSSGVRALLQVNAQCPSLVVRGLRPQLQRVISLIAPGLMAYEP
jgi:anti-anti-sigma factor